MQITGHAGWSAANQTRLVRLVCRVEQNMSNKPDKANYLLRIYQARWVKFERIVVRANLSRLDGSNLSEQLNRQMI